MTEEKDEFEKLKKRIKEDTWEDYEGNHSHIDYDTIIEIIEEFKPKLKAQILQDNPMAGLTSKQMQAYIDVEHLEKCTHKKTFGDCEICQIVNVFKRELSRRREKEE